MLEAPLVVDDRASRPVSTGGTRFWKLTGSGNDFVFFDARDGAVELDSADAIRALSARGTGVGADGVVFLERSPTASVRIRYFNSDGSPAELCGNATLCTARLAATIGAADPAGMTIDTAAGVISARVAGDDPEIDFAPVTLVRAAEPSVTPASGERRVGYANTGVPHLVALVDDLESIDIIGRGRQLRYTPELPGGANVNFVARTETGWAMRTYERGVEGETLACGTGAVATGLLLSIWGEASLPVSLQTRSGRLVTISATSDGDSWRPKLRGEGRIVFEGIFPAR